jgi:alanine racemase
VALVEEGIGLRERGIEAPILVLSEFPRGSERDALAARLTPAVYSRDGVARVAEAGRALDLRVGVHLKIDTGMHRVGVWPPSDAVEIAHAALDAGLELEALWTHFACADSDDEATRGQLATFLEIRDSLAGAGIIARMHHAANSAATLRYPDAHLDLVRPGVALYGVDPGGGLAESAGLRPALSWRSEVTMVKRLPAGERISYGWRYRLERDAWIATVPVGYEDGYLRALSNRADVLIGGRRRRVAGSVTMDQLVVEIGDDDVHVGDEVVLVGTQGDERITADELAGHAGTIGYEIVTSIGARVPRVHVGASA